MSPPFRRVALAFVLALLPAGVLAQSDITTRRPSFIDGRTTVKGSFSGHATTDVIFPAGAGESIDVTLKSNKSSVTFNVNPPGSEVAIFIGSSEGSVFQGVAPVSGDYTARVYLMRNEARRGTTARYRLTIGLGQTAAAKATGPDFADGLSGGPDFWKVAGLAKGDRLALRRAPSPQSDIIAQIANGAALKNLGCKNARGQRWCQVEQVRQAAQRGWVNGRVLREGSGVSTP
jgi:hypothetical protein